MLGRLCSASQGHGCDGAAKVIVQDVGRWVTDKGICRLAGRWRGCILCTRIGVLLQWAPKAVINMRWQTVEAIIHALFEWWQCCMMGLAIMLGRLSSPHPNTLAALRRVGISPNSTHCPLPTAAEFQSFGLGVACRWYEGIRSANQQELDISRLILDNASRWMSAVSLLLINC